MEDERSVLELPALRTAIALIAKVPEAGKAKTRFSPPCSEAQAAEFATAFLRDTAAVVDSVPGADAWCAFLGDAEEMRELLPPDYQLLAQRGEDLDDRLANVADDLFMLGYDRVAVVGADCPTIDSAYLQASLDGLHDHDVVVGPANDGGYVLLAQRVQERSLYEGIVMSTDTVCDETIERASRAGLSCARMEELHDLDTVAQLVAASDAGQLAHAKSTTQLMEQLGSLLSQH